MVGGLGKQGSDWWPHIPVQINWEEQLGSETDHAAERVPASGNKASKPKNLWGLWQQEKIPDSQESSLERPTRS